MKLRVTQKRSKMHYEEVKPADIEKKSFEIITRELGDTVPDSVNAPVIKRVIHTTADFDFAKTLRFTKGAVEKGRELFKNGATLITDTNMALAGVNKTKLKNFGCDAFCFMADEDVKKEASGREVTRASVSMEKSLDIPGEKVYAIGNAPTALITLSELIRQDKLRPGLIIAVPVGFVNVEAAKEEIAELCDKEGIACIAAMGRKGGSTVAAAIVNAILYGM